MHVCGVIARTIPNALRRMFLPWFVMFVVVNKHRSIYAANAASPFNRIIALFVFYGRTKTLLIARNVDCAVWENRRNCSIAGNVVFVFPPVRHMSVWPNNRHEIGSVLCVWNRHLTDNKGILLLDADIRFM